MKVFLSYASEDKNTAESIQLALIGHGHIVFFDQQSLPAGGDYHARIAAAVLDSDLMVYLISPDSVAPGSYALTELGHARRKWPHPKERVVPVIVRQTDWRLIPTYLTSVTILEPHGNVAAEVLMAIEVLCATRHAPPAEPPRVETKRKLSSAHVVAISVAVIGFLGSIGAAYIASQSESQPEQVAARALAQPRLSHPFDNTLFSDYPRITTLRWLGVEGATRYLLEIQYQLPTTGEWYYLPKYPAVIEGEEHRFNFPGAQPGRWRVTALGRDEIKSEPSAWWHFDYQR